MSIAAKEKLYSPEDLLSLPGVKGYELVDGRLVEKAMGGASSTVTVRLVRRLSEFVDTHGLGEVFDAECGYQCFEWAPRNVRKPDASFIRRDRLSAPPRGNIRIAPDLAVEVASPNDLHSELTLRTEEYLRAGVRLVWVISPDGRTVDIFRQNGCVARVHEGDMLDGEDVLPGFAFRLGEILPAMTRVTDGETV